MPLRPQRNLKTRLLTAGLVTSAISSATFGQNYAVSTFAGSELAPYAVTGSSAQRTVTYQGQTASAPTVAVATSATGLFIADSTGKGQAAAVNEDGSINSASRPAPVGSVIALFATGDGQTSPQGVDGKTATVPYPKPRLPVSVTIADWPDTQTINGEQLKYVGGVPGEVAGLMQISVRIPAGITRVVPCRCR
jgi:uncharacterized protein (TIGR03437 family)